MCVASSPCFIAPVAHSLGRSHREFTVVKSHTGHARRYKRHHKALCGPKPENLDPQCLNEAVLQTHAWQVPPELTSRLGRFNTLRDASACQVDQPNLSLIYKRHSSVLTMQAKGVGLGTSTWLDSWAQPCIFGRLARAFPRLMLYHTSRSVGSKARIGSEFPICFILSYVYATILSAVLSATRTSLRSRYVQ